jgi:hypothetical protein
VQPIPELRVGNIGMTSDGRITFSWSTETGHKYRVQYRDDLLSGDWIDLAGPITADGPQASQTDTSPAARQRFYRIVLME